jgi:hypothetical protein
VPCVLIGDPVPGQMNAVHALKAGLWSRSRKEFLGGVGRNFMWSRKEFLGGVGVGRNFMWSRKEFYVESESEGIFRWSRSRKEF